MRPIDPAEFRRFALLLAAGATSACGGGSSSAHPPRHTDPTVGGNGNPPVVEGAVTVNAGYCDYATGTYYDPTGEAWWNGGPDGTCYAPVAEGGYVDPSGEYYAPVYEG